MIAQKRKIELLQKLIPVAAAAGEAIMDVYRQGVSVTDKSDGTPVTEADRRAEKIILAGLKEHAPDIPVVSEENAESHGLSPSAAYFLVDPLDGTREFIKQDGKGEFTVNIGLIENREAVFGVLYAPALDRMFSGLVGKGAFEGDVKLSSGRESIQDRVAVASVSHRDEKTENWLNQHQISKTRGIGSSLKFCLLATGDADVYPRFGPTMEWDTAAGHAILNAAGGRVETPDGQPFLYGKPDYRNTAFIAWANTDRDAI